MTFFKLSSMLELDVSSFKCSVWKTHADPRTDEMQGSLCMPYFECFSQIYSLCLPWTLDNIREIVHLLYKEKKLLISFFKRAFDVRVFSQPLLIWSSLDERRSKEDMRCESEMRKKKMDCFLQYFLTQSFVVKLEKQTSRSFVLLFHHRLHGLIIH